MNGHIQNVMLRLKNELSTIYGERLKVATCLAPTREGTTTKNRTPMCQSYWTT